MTVTSDFWLALHELNSALEVPASQQSSSEVLTALQDDFEHLPRATQCELRRELQSVIVGLARLDSHLSLDSLADAWH